MQHSTMELETAGCSENCIPNPSVINKIKLIAKAQRKLDSSRSDDGSNPDASVEGAHRLSGTSYEEQVFGAVCTQEQALNGEIIFIKDVIDKPKTNSTSKNDAGEFPGSNDPKHLTAAASSILSSFDWRHVSATSPRPSSLSLLGAELNNPCEGSVHGESETKRTTEDSSQAMLKRLSLDGIFNFTEDDNDFYWEDSGLPFEFSQHADLNNNDSLETQKQPHDGGVQSGERLGNDRTLQHTNFKAAISTDSRQYNVFTFLGDDVYGVNSDDEDGEGDAVSSGAPTATTTESLDDVHSSPVPQEDIAEALKAETQSAPSPHDGHIATTLSDNFGSRLKVITEDETPDLDLPAITSFSAEDDVVLPRVKRKIVPSMPFDPDVTLSPGSSLPDLYEFGGRRTPDELDDSVLHDADEPDFRIDVLSNSVFGPDLDWEDSPDPIPNEPISEYSGMEELQDGKKWRIVQIGEKSYRVDMESIDVYKKVLSHGGYYGEGLNAIIVFTACHLPEKTASNYHYIMDNLFLYVMSTLELLVVQEYMIVYFHSASSRRKLPGLRWFKRCYDMINRRLRKNLQGLLVVHPTLFLKTVMVMMKPFVSSKFSSKMRYVNSLAELTRHVPTEYMFIPDEVIQLDKLWNPAVPIPPKKFVNC